MRDRLFDRGLLRDGLFDCRLFDCRLFDDRLFDDRLLRDGLFDGRLLDRGLFHRRLFDRGLERADVGLEREHDGVGRRALGREGQEATRGLDVLELPSELTRLQRQEARVVGIREVGEALVAEHDQVGVGTDGADRSERGDVPREIVAGPVLVGELERLPIEVRGHLRVLQPDLPDRAELGQRGDPLADVLDQARATILQRLDVLKVTALLQEQLGDEAGLGVLRVGVERLEQGRKQARIFGRLLLEDPSGTHEQPSDLSAEVGHFGAERIIGADQRLELTEDVVERELPVVAIVERLLEAGLMDGIARLGRGGEEALGRVDVSLVELRGPVGVVETRGARRILIRAQLEAHQLGHHLERGHLAIDLACTLERDQVGLIELERLLVTRHRSSLVEQHVFTGTREIVERERLLWAAREGAGFRFDLVDDRVPVLDFFEPCLDPLSDFHLGPMLPASLGNFTGRGADIARGRQLAQRE